MDFSKLLNAIRGNKNADTSAVSKDKTETEPTIPVEVAPSVAAVDHPPAVRTSGGIVQSLFTQFTGGHREPPVSTQPDTPLQSIANSYDDALASVLPPEPATSSPAPSAVVKPALPLESSVIPLEDNWFDVSLDQNPPTATVDVPVLDLPLDVPVPDITAPAPPSGDVRPTTPPPTPAVDSFEVHGRVDLSWTPAEAPAGLPSITTSPAGGMGTPPVDTPPFASTEPAKVSLPETAYAAPLPVDVTSAVGDLPQGTPIETPLAPVNDWGFPSSDPVAITPPSVVATAPVAALEETATAALRSPQPASRSDWLLENLDEALILLDDQGIIQQVNPMGEYLFGTSRENLLGRSLLEVSQQLGGENAPLWEHLAVTSETQQFSTNVVLPDGQSMMASFVVLELPAQETWPSGRILAIRDETRLRAEFAQMMEDLTPSTATTSALQVTPEQLTSMRTSLQMVLGFAELLHRGEYGPMNPQQFEMFRNIEHHAKQLAGWLGLPQ
ncbi:MAG: PAS domain-containing protein [Acidobacteriota bacterium]